MESHYAYVFTALTSPTDKARAIFKWLHFNIRYDTVSYFSHNVKHSTPANTLKTGLAVCQGYAELFQAIAKEAGLECIVISGHGKGHSYSFKAGDPLPTFETTNHSWCAVRIDNDEWKLVDPCWGAGHVDGVLYVRHFNENWFSMSNEEFGEQHYPQDPSKFFRKDKRQVSWKEYILGETNGEIQYQCYSFPFEYGVNASSFLPLLKRIAVNNKGTTHFQFHKKCQHWDFGSTRFQMFLLAGGVKGDEEKYVPFIFNGTTWSLDIMTSQLGLPGQKVGIYALTDSEGGQKYYSGLARWELY
jgi:hypothetical protein